ncbi:uncharacterized [Tachysurus ichikawai]
MQWVMWTGARPSQPIDSWQQSNNSTLLAWSPSFDRILETEKVSLFVAFLTGKALEIANVAWNQGITDQSCQHFGELFQHIFIHSIDGKDAESGC